MTLLSPRGCGPRRRWRASRSRTGRSLLGWHRLGDKAVAAEEWRPGEILAWRGDAILLEPRDLREDRDVPSAREQADSPRGTPGSGRGAGGGPGRDFSTRGEFEGERRAFARRRVHFERPAVGLGDRPGDEEAEPRAGLRVLAARTAELLEDERLLCSGSPPGPGPTPSRLTPPVVGVASSLHLGARGRVPGRHCQSGFVITCRSRSRSPRTAGGPRAFAWIRTSS